MGVEETNLTQKVRLREAKKGALLFRNNRGAYTDENGRWVFYGIGGNGGSDLIGGTPVKITQEMINTTILVFTAYEIKTPEGMKPSGKKAKEHFAEQQKFIDVINNAGGIASFIWE